MEGLEAVARVALVGALLGAGCPRGAVTHAFNYLKAKPVPDRIEDMIAQLDEAIAYGRKVANIR